MSRLKTLFWRFKLGIEIICFSVDFYFDFSKSLYEEEASMRQQTMRVQIQHWEMGVAGSDEISRRFLEKTDHGPNTVGPRSYDHSLLRFKLLMGMMVWTHAEAGVKFRGKDLPDLGYHLTVSYFIYFCYERVLSA